MLERVPKYTLRKLSVGLASVMIGSGILMNSPKVLADTINPNEGTSTAVQPSSQDKDNSEPSTQSGATQDENIDSNAAVQERSDNSVTEPATTTNAEEKVVATNTQDTTQDKDKQTNANETTQNTTNVDKKDTEVTPTNDATTATPKTTAKVNAPAAPTAMLLLKHQIQRFQITQLILLLSMTRIVWKKFGLKHLLRGPRSTLPLRELIKKSMSVPMQNSVSDLIH